MWRDSPKSSPRSILGARAHATDNRAMNRDRAGAGERAARVVAEGLIIFAGVTAAFLVEGYRDDLEDSKRLEQATAGIITEMTHYATRSREHADSITARIDAWRRADSAGRRAVPGYYRIPGAPHPPTAAWDAAVASGVASLFEPELRLDLGYFYNEFVGVHDNYVRYLEFAEREILPRAEVGPDEFYDTAGRLRPEFRSYMRLFQEFADDLRGLAATAEELRSRLETMSGG